MTTEQEIELLKDTLSKQAATIVAHEEFLTILLKPVFRSLTDEQREVMLAAMATGPDVSSPSVRLTDNVGIADQIAGLVMARKDAISRIARRAMGSPDPQ